MAIAVVDAEVEESMAKLLVFFPWYFLAGGLLSSAVCILNLELVCSSHARLGLLGMSIAAKKSSPRSPNESSSSSISSNEPPPLASCCSLSKVGAFVVPSRFCFCLFKLSRGDKPKTCRSRLDWILANLMPSSYLMNESMRVCLKVPASIRWMIGEISLFVSSATHPMWPWQKATRPSRSGTPQENRSSEVSTTGFIYAFKTLASGKCLGAIHRVRAVWCFRWNNCSFSERIPSPGFSLSK
mmetsp:Transcript_2640/g.5928  ORF Transcript_2640/g.5928 Transcript_2640/m.5928 type:complete len:241 (+) Transcript_2640:1620-2342(+)